MSIPVVASVFPGVGKTTAANRINSDYDAVLNFEDNHSWSAIDHESSRFHDKKNPQADWANNYVRSLLEIQQALTNDGLGSAGLVWLFVSSHREVRRALCQAGVRFFLVYPSLNRKKEFAQLYYDRGSSEDFRVRLWHNWDNWLFDCIEQSDCFHICAVSPRTYLWDYLPYMEQVALREKL